LYQSWSNEVLALPLSGTASIVPAVVAFIVRLAFVAVVSSTVSVVT
jgi:hypothetical protein